RFMPPGRRRAIAPSSMPSPVRIISRRSTALPTRLTRSAAGSPTGFSHRLEEVYVGATHRQLAMVAAHANEEPAQLVAARALEVVEVDDRRPVHLHEPLGIELRRELGDRRPDQVLCVRGPHAGVLVVGLEEED